MLQILAYLCLYGFKIQFAFKITYSLSFAKFEFLLVMIL